MLDINMIIYVFNDFKLVINEIELIVFVNVLLYVIIVKFIFCVFMIVFGGFLLYSFGIKGRY